MRSREGGGADAQGPLGHVSVGSLTRGVTRLSEADNRPDFCQDFSLTKEQVAKYMAAARQVTAIDFHGNHMWLPCFVAADIRVGEQPAKLTISASFTARIVYPDSKEHFLVCEDECQRALDFK